MLSRFVGIGLVAAVCAGGGAYMALRQNTAGAAQTPASVTPAAAAPANAQPVTETEAVVGTPADRKPAETVKPPAPEPQPQLEQPSARPARETPRRPSPAVARATASRDQSPRQKPRETAAEATPAGASTAATSAPVQPAPEPAPRAEPPTPPTPPQPQFEELVLPAASVIGLEIESALSSEQARVEDRVDARVTRDVYVDGRLVIPSRSRMIGGVTLVERGGKVKERARLGVRFHTLVLDDGRQIAVRTETILREGEPPSGESSKKIGGAAIGGAVLGAIMGGGKGAVLGGAAGAAGGTAAVLAGGRNAAVLPAGTIVTARVASPVAIEVEKR